MIGRLRTPDGPLGVLSLASALVLALVGVAGTLGILLALLTGSDAWSDARSDNVIALVFFVVVGLGAVGFLEMDRSLWPATALAVVGSLAWAVLMFWAVVPLVVGVGAAVVAVMRARALSHPATTAPIH